MGETSEKEKRNKMIQEEFDQIIGEADNFCLEFLEEDMDPEAVEALKKAANKVRVTKCWLNAIRGQHCVRSVPVVNDTDEQWTE